MKGKKRLSEAKELLIFNISWSDILLEEMKSRIHEEQQNKHKLNRILARNKNRF